MNEPYEEEEEGPPPTSRFETILGNVIGALILTTSVVLGGVLIPVFLARRKLEDD